MDFCSSEAIRGIGFNKGQIWKRQPNQMPTGTLETPIVNNTIIGSGQQRTQVMGDYWRARVWFKEEPKIARLKDRR